MTSSANVAGRQGISEAFRSAATSKLPLIAMTERRTAAPISQICAWCGW
jgi:hypothetical protein